MSEKTKKWFKAAGIRAIKTIAQTAVATIGTAAVISAVDWKFVVSAAVLAGIISLLTSIGGLPEVKMEEQIEDDLSCKPELPEDYYEPEEQEHE